MLGVTQLWAGAQYFAKLPGYLRRPLSVEQARAGLAERLAARDERFLEKVRLDIYGQPASPYLELLRHAGCELGDIESGVRRDGIEATLRRLFRAGVYLTVDEFKGRSPAKRGTKEVAVSPQMLRAPRASYHVPARSGGSRSAGTPVMIDLAFIGACAGNSAVSLAARSERKWLKSSWESPGAGLRFRAVKFSGFGDPVAATFTPFDPYGRELGAYYRWNLRMLDWVSRLAGRRIPQPVYAPFRNPAPLAEWLRDSVKAGGTPMVLTFPSLAVVLCRWATENGVDIAGSWFTLTGEAITPARVATIRAAGCTAIPRYGTMEVGAIGYGCPEGRQSDDLHLLSDMHALIQAGEDGGKLPPKALLMTSLHAQTPFVMLNLSMGDQAEMEPSRCGCGLQAAGWKTRIWNIRSFEKLNGAGVTFEGTHVIRVLEEELPARFGGAPTDYQLVELERKDGTAVLELVVHPRLEGFADDEVVEAFLDAMSRQSPHGAMMVRNWRDLGTLSVARRAPSVTRSGKFNHLHVIGPS